MVCTVLDGTGLLIAGWVWPMTSQMRILNENIIMWLCHKHKKYIPKEELWVRPAAMVLDDVAYRPQSFTTEIVGLATYAVPGPEDNSLQCLEPLIRTLLPLHNICGIFILILRD